MSLPMLTLSGASVRIAERLLFGPVEVAVGSGDRVGLVGRNGAGKSTLLKALAGTIELDGGARHVQPRTSIVYLPQEPELPVAGDARAAVLLGLPPDQRPDGAWQADSLLAELDTDPTMAVLGMSGGEARRVSLARALIARPDILLLDEPTNHLDITAIEWLEETLAAMRGGIVTISHDRSFLRRLSTSTWWLDRGQLHTQDRGYEHFEAWSEQLLDAEAAATARLDKKLDAETHWLHRGVTARRKRNMGRLRKLHELRAARRGLIARTGSVRLETTAERAGGSLVIEASGIVKSFGQRTVIDGFSTRIMKGDRIGVIGPNGAGKSTLVKLLLGEMTPDAGSVRHGTELQVARFEQDRASLDPAATPWEVLCPEGGDQVMVGGRWRHVVGYLRDFLFRDDQVRTPLRALSGGERNRLLLARILARPANLLVLDEPTNDLDMDTLDLLTEALADFEGTLILVSHDRDFLDRLVTSTIAFEGGGRVREYAGGYADWMVQRASMPLAPRQRAPLPSRPMKPVLPAPRLDAKLARELDRLPARIAAAETAVRAAEEALADPTLFRRDATAFERGTEALGEAKAELARLEDRWLELEALRETVEA